MQLHNCPKIQICGGLVKHINIRGHGVAGGDGHLLHLTAGQLKQVFVRQLGNIDLFKTVLCALPYFFPRQLHIDTAKGYLVCRIRHKELTSRALKDGADDSSKIAQSVISGIPAIQIDLAAKCAFVEVRNKPIDAAGKRCFPAAACAADKHKRALFDFEVNSMNSRLGVTLILIRYLPQLNRIILHLR